ncbi:MAG TPA: uroporphyrinogen decarboxylase family protein [Spirochaetota bacterium]|nr:uroporphyrinogen decarboxylase family protein [Spirochaetota bacterium]
MTSRERLLKTLQGQIPDCVPAAPDISNMIPAKLTGMPFWDIYLYKKKPIWEAYIEAARYFDIDALMDGYFPLVFNDEPYFYSPFNTTSYPLQEAEEYIIFKNEERIITRKAWKIKNKLHWNDTVDVYYVADPPTEGVKPETIGLPPEPKHYELLKGQQEVDCGPEGFKKIKNMMGDQGLVGTFITTSITFENEEQIYRYYDQPDMHNKWAAAKLEKAEKRFHQVMAMDIKPDFLCVGGSGTLLYQTMEMFRKISFPAVKRIIELAQEAGMMTHMHSCGPESRLVKIMAEETGLTVIDPLEIPPMGDCNLARLKKDYGDKLTLKGNLHTTETMLKGSVDDVVQASKKAIDDAAAGGRFILSTGDQCGRDTPLDNLHALVETARTYGRYK